MVTYLLSLLSFTDRVVSPGTSSNRESRQIEQLSYQLIKESEYYFFSRCNRSTPRDSNI